MKCFIKAGLYAVAFGLLIFTIALPAMVDLLATYGPDVLTTTKYNGTKCLSPGMCMSSVFLGFATFIGSIFGFIEASNIKCD